MRFFDAQTNGTQLGADVTGTVQVTPEGLFNLAAPFPPAALASSTLWYELGIDSDTPTDGNANDDLFPERIRVHSVPFALEAGTVSQVDATRIGDGVVDDTEFGYLDGVTGSLQTSLDAKAETADLNAHVNDSGNPHGVTATQVGLGAVDNTADADKPVSSAMQSALNTKADAGVLNGHISDTLNPHSVTAAQVGLGLVDNTADANKPVSSATQDALDEKLPTLSEAYVVVEVGANVTANGDNLRAAYATAAALTPFGSPLSAANRAVVVVPPGQYDLGSSALTMDTEFVDVVGLSTARENQHIYRNGNVLVQVAMDVRIENLKLEYTGEADNEYAYYPDVAWLFDAELGSPPETTIRNCEFVVASFFLRNMREGVTYAGLYVDCKADPGEYAFGGLGKASGTFINCTGDRDSFAGNGEAYGTFTNCTGGSGAFGGGSTGLAYGTFTNCTGGSSSFGGSGTAGGDFLNCNGASSSFGGNGTASGEFINCVGGDRAFGGKGTASGFFINCRGEDYSFGSAGGPGISFGLANGEFSNCVGGEFAFGGDDGGSAVGGRFYHCVGGPGSYTTDGSPTLLYCIQDGAAYP
jgi:hypothetical protein